MENTGLGYKLTVKEFFEYMKSLGAENYTMLVQYRDGGGDYNGLDEEIRCFVDDGNQSVTL